ASPFFQALVNPIAVDRAGTGQPVPAATEANPTLALQGPRHFVAGPAAAPWEPGTAADEAADTGPAAGGAGGAGPAHAPSRPNPRPPPPSPPPLLAPSTPPGVSPCRCPTAPRTPRIARTSMSSTRWTASISSLGCPSPLTAPSTCTR